jgi:hypothetical protein
MELQEHLYEEGQARKVRKAMQINNVNNVYSDEWVSKGKSIIVQIGLPNAA